MNNERRAKIDEIVSQLEIAKSLLETVKGEEEEAYSALPESFQNGERGEKMQESLNALESTESSLEEALNYLEEAKGQ